MNEDSANDGLFGKHFVKHAPIWVLRISVAIVVGVFGAYLYKFWSPSFSTNPENWGLLGDYIGGMLNPVVAGGALVLLYVSVRIQQTELKETKQALVNQVKILKQQQDESLFFNVFGFRERIIDKFQHGKVIGAAGFERWAAQMIDTKEFESAFSFLGEVPSDKILKRVGANYHTLFSAYVSSIEVILKVIDGADSESMADNFIQILVGMMSDVEFVVVFVYGCRYPDKLGTLANQYGMFDEIAEEYVSLECRRSVQEHFGWNVQKRVSL